MIVNKVKTGSRLDSNGDEKNTYRPDIPDGVMYAKIRDVGEDKIEIRIIGGESVLESGDFHRGINFLTFQDNEVRVVHDGELSLKEMIDGLIENLKPDQPIKAKDIELLLKYRTEFRRMNTELIEMATGLGMSAEHIDEFFEDVENEIWKN